MFDKLIISRFKLFSGIRTQAEDEKILNKIREAVKEETARFVTDNAKVKVNTTNVKAAIETIPFWRLRLTTRIEYYLAKLNLEAKEVHERRGV